MTHRRSPIIIILAVLAVLTTSGCKKKRKPGATAVDAGASAIAPASRMLSVEEGARITKWFLLASDDNRKRVCKRPVLRGTPAPGDADADLRALAEPQGDLAACVEALAKDGEALRAQLRRCPEPDKSAVDHPPLCEALALGKPPSAEAARVLAACASLPAALSRAAAHEDACSPYLPGHFALGSLLPATRLARAAGLLVQARAAGGKLDQSLQVGTDMVRVAHDLARGGVSFVGLMTSMAAAESPLADLVLLVGSGKLSSAALTALASELDRLIAGAPHFSEFLLGEAVQVGDMFMRQEAQRALDGQQQPVELAGIDARDLYFLTLEALQLTATERQAACPAGSPLGACFVALAEAEKSRGPGVEAPLTAAENASPIARRAAVSQRLRSEAKVGVARQAARYGFSLARLVALRLAVEARRVAGGKGCPALATFAAPPLVDLAGESLLGAKLTARMVDGQLEFSAPAWTVPPNIPDSLSVALRLSCSQ